MGDCSSMRRISVGIVLENWRPCGPGGRSSIIGGSCMVVLGGVVLILAV